MAHTLIVIAVFCTIYIGMAGLCLAMARHYEQIFNKEPSLLQQRLLYWGGWFLLAISLIFSIVAWGTVIGITAWVGVLTAMTGLLIFLFSYQQRLAMTGAAACLPLSIICPLAYLIVV